MGVSIVYKPLVWNISQSEENSANIMKVHKSLCKAAVIFPHFSEIRFFYYFIIIISY
jgi:hypothetical protein